MLRSKQPWRTNRAKALRRSQTAAEERLWAELRHRRLKGHKFVRQAPIGPFFVDFLCREHRVVVEIDGATHGTNAEVTRDEVRSKYLEAQGYRVFRALNEEIYKNMSGVLDSLLDFVDEAREE
jgi:very-short-patch-repair endonuclease